MNTEDGRSPVCAYCGYSLHGLKSACCPECGKKSPDELSSITSDALLPWERRIGRLEIFRFVLTINAAWFHYLAYVRTLSRRRGTILYQRRHLVLWIALSAFVMPFVSATASGILYPEPIIRYGLSVKWVEMVWRMLWVSSGLTWHLTLPAGLILGAQVFSVSGILVLASHLGRLQCSYYVALLAIAPVYLLLALLDGIAASILLWMPLARDIRLESEDVWVLDLLQLCGVIICVFLVLRIVCCSRWHVVVATLFATGMAEWWLFPLIYRVIALVTDASPWPFA